MKRSLLLTTGLVSCLAVAGMTGITGAASASGSLVFAPNPLDFGSVTVNSRSMAATTVTNTGASAVTPTGIVVWGRDAGYDSGTCQKQVAIPPGGSCTIVAFWWPNDTGVLSSAEVSITYDGGASTDKMPMTGRAIPPPPPPADPSSASRRVQPSGATLVTWAAVPGATQYEVSSSGRRLCTVDAPTVRCLVPQAYGPRVGVWVVAISASGTSDGREAKYHEASEPVVVASVPFPSGSAALTRQAGNTARSTGKQLAKKGFFRVAVVGSGRQGLARAGAVRSVLLRQFESMNIDDAKITTRTGRTSGRNSVSITVR